MPAPTSTAAPAGTSPFTYPAFREIWIASLVSNFGGLIQSVGASWSMASLGASAQLVALVQAATSLPIMLLSLWAGALADNVGRRAIMMAAQGFMLVASAALAVWAWSGQLTPGVLLLFTFLIACGTAINGPAWQASVGDMVPRASVPAAVGLNSMGFNLARSAGPAIGGAIVAAAGAAAAFLVNAVSYLGLIVVLMRWRPTVAPRVLPRERLATAMVAGATYVALSRDMRVILLRAAAFGVSASVVPAMMPLVARDLVRGGPLAYGVLLGAFGLGAVAGASLSGRLRRSASSERIVRGACAAAALGTIATALSRDLPLTIPALALAGGGWVLALSTFNVGVQLLSPRWVVARALSLYQMAAFGGMAFGSWLFGVVADHRGAAGALMLGAVALLVVMLMGWRLPLPAMGGNGVEPRGGWTPPETALPIEWRSGPIMLTVEHHIAAGDVPRFLALMHERRRIRRSDGARRWTLLRDLADPGLWVERYEFSTWLDYVRHNERRTVTEAANAAALRELDGGGGDPHVHRLIERRVTSPTSAAPAREDVQREAVTDPTRAS